MEAFVPLQDILLHITKNDRSKKGCVDCPRAECQTHFHRGHISLEVAFKGPNVILGLYKCNYSLTVKQELSCRWVETRCPLKQGGGPDSAPRALCLPPVS